jgi:GAF domain-containing protein
MLACRNVPPPFEDFLTRPMQALTGGSLERLLRGEAFVQIIDVRDGDQSTAGRRALVEFAQARTVLWIPLRKESAVLGAFVIYRQEVKPFTDKQIALLQNFAAQAVIAMENARLVTETREALEQQTATAEVLQVINNSPGELAPVFDAILEKAQHLCGATNGLLVTRDGEYFRTVAARAADAELLRRPFQAMPNSPHGLLSVGERVVHIPDVVADTQWDRNDPRRAIAIEHGLRTMLFVALRKDDALLGYIGANRHEVRPFSDKEIALLEGFAAQAVIAMENARLLGELRERTADLARSVDELTATGDVLKIISRSSVDLVTVLDTLVETVARLCRADHALMFRRREDLYHLFASRGITAEAKNFFLAHPFAAGRETVTGRTALERRAVHIADVMQDPAYTYGATTLTGARTLLGIPLLREEALVGIFVLGRTRVEPFTNKEIELPPPSRIKR